MKAVILPQNQNANLFRAVAGNKSSFGKTAGEAIDALDEKLASDERNTVVFVQDFQPDEFFNAEQQQRLAFLMNEWRAARDENRELEPDEQTELAKLIDEELDASGRRAEKLADLLGK